MLSLVAYDSWVLHALIWLPLLGMGHVLWASEDRAKHLAFRWSMAVFVLSLGLHVIDGYYHFSQSVKW